MGEVRVHGEELLEAPPCVTLHAVDEQGNQQDEKQEDEDSNASEAAEDWGQTGHGGSLLGGEGLRRACATWLRGGRGGKLEARPACPPFLAGGVDPAHHGDDEASPATEG
jgi:hypothetical protein